MKHIKAIFGFIGFLGLSSCWWTGEPLRETPVSGKVNKFVHIDEASRLDCAIAIDKNEILVLREPENGRPFFDVIAYDFDGKIKRSIEFERIFSETNPYGGARFVEGDMKRYLLFRKDGFDFVFPVQKGKGYCSPIWKGKVDEILVVEPIKQSSDLLIIKDREIYWLRDGKIIKKFKEDKIPRWVSSDGQKTIFWGDLDSVTEIDLEKDQIERLPFLDVFGCFPGNMIGYSYRKNIFIKLDLKTKIKRKFSSPVRGVHFCQLPNSVLFYREEKKLFFLFNRNGVFKLKFPEHIKPVEFMVGRKQNEIVFKDIKNRLWFVEFDHPQIEF